jgi:predicted DNA-binding protein with PD1-like motif
MDKRNVFAAILSSTGALVLAATVSFGVASTANAATTEVGTGTEIISVSGASGILAE